MSKELKVLELFSGIGAQHKALTNIGIKSICTQCDIDKYAIQSYNAIHGETENLGDISLLDVSKFEKDQWDLVTYSSPCFVGDTLVWVEDKDGNNTFIPIKDFNDEYKVVTLNLDDYCLTTKPAKLLYQGIKDTVEVTFSNTNKVICTDNHRFYSNNEWNEIKSLIGKEVLTVSNINNKLCQNEIEHNDNLLYVNEITPFVKQEVYDLSVEDYHWFFIKVGDEKVLVHNCQDFSSAGLQAGGEKGSGTRSSLLWEVEKVIESVRPKYLLMENVKALVSKKFLPCFEKWVETLNSYGYKTYWKVLNAKDFGVPQNRERVFAVSIRNDIDQEYVFPEGHKLQIRLKDILEPSVEPKYYLSQQVQDRFQFKPKGADIIGTTAPDFRTIGQRDIVFGTEGTMGTLVATDYKQPKQIIEYDNDEPMICASRGRNPENPSDRTVGAPTEQRLEINSQGISNTLTSVSKDNWVLEPQERMTKQAFETLNENDCKDGDVINPFNKRVVSDGTCPTITTRPEGFKTANLIVEEPKQNRLFNIYGEDKGEGYAGNVWDKDGISPTLKTMQGGNSQPLVYDEPQQEKSYKIRKLTPRECYRLMGFSDEDFDKVKAIGMSDCQCYKQAGNSIVVNCLMAIFTNMFKDTEYMDMKEYEEKLVEELDKAIENIELKQYDITQEVRVRANEVDIEGLQTLLRDRKKSSGLSNEEIATKLNKPLTHVAHWFRTDNCFSIPTEDVWYQLKEVLNITTDAFDKQVTEFVTKDGVFDTANRAYDSEGLSPTITASLAPNVVEEQLDLVDWIHEQEEKESAMTIDEAIEHATEVSNALGDCECGKEHKQLANWLEELKEIKNGNVENIIDKPESIKDIVEIEEIENEIDDFHLPTFEEEVLVKLDKIIDLLEIITLNYQNK